MWATLAINGLMREIVQKYGRNFYRLYFWSLLYVELWSGPLQTSNMNIFATMVNGF